MSKDWIVRSAALMLIVLTMNLQRLMQSDGCRVSHPHGV